MFTIKPGEFYGTTRPVIVATVLGSCVSACIHDVRKRSGGMNHFMLPERSADPGLQDNLKLHSYGIFAMETLINEFIRRGSRRKDLEAKVFGGASVVESLNSQVGIANSRFVLQYLETEGIRLVSMDIGGIAARRVLFFSDTGRALVKYLGLSANAAIEATRLAAAREAPCLDSAIELF
jgi:chemotaxis protein CheD